MNDNIICYNEVFIINDSEKENYKEINHEQYKEINFENQENLDIHNDSNINIIDKPMKSNRSSLFKNNNSLKDSKEESSVKYFNLLRNRKASSAKSFFKNPIKYSNENTNKLELSLNSMSDSKNCESNKNLPYLLTNRSRYSLDISNYSDCKFASNEKYGAKKNDFWLVSNTIPNHKRCKHLDDVTIVNCELKNYGNKIKIRKFLDRESIQIKKVNIDKKNMKHLNVSRSQNSLKHIHQDNYYKNENQRDFIKSYQKIIKTYDESDSTYRNDGYGLECNVFEPAQNIIQDRNETEVIESENTNSNYINTFSFQNKASLSSIYRNHSINDISDGIVHENCPQLVKSASPQFFKNEFNKTMFQEKVPSFEPIRSDKFESSNNLQIFRKEENDEEEAIADKIVLNPLSNNDLDFNTDNKVTDDDFGLNQPYSETRLLSVNHISNKLENDLNSEIKTFEGDNQSHNNIKIIYEQESKVNQILSEKQVSIISTLEEPLLDQNIGEYGVDDTSPLQIVKSRVIEKPEYNIISSVVDEVEYVNDSNLTNLNNENVFSEDLLNIVLEDTLANKDNDKIITENRVEISNVKSEKIEINMTELLKRNEISENDQEVLYLNISQLSEEKAQFLTEKNVDQIIIVKKDIDVENKDDLYVKEDIKELGKEGNKFNSDKKAEPVIKSKKEKQNIISSAENSELKPEKLQRNETNFKKGQ